MWDNLRIHERDRRLGLLFVNVLLAVCAAGAFSLGFAGPAVGLFILGICCAVMMRRLTALRRGKPGPAPVGPLSPDERVKARSKLLGARVQSVRMR